MCKQTFLCPSTSYSHPSLEITSTSQSKNTTPENHSWVYPTTPPHQLLITWVCPRSLLQAGRSLALLWRKGPHENAILDLLHSPWSVTVVTTKSPAFFCGESIFPIFCGVFKKKLSTQIGMKFFAFFSCHVALLDFLSYKASDSLQKCLKRPFNYLSSLTTCGTFKAWPAQT